MKGHQGSEARSRRWARLELAVLVLATPPYLLLAPRDIVVYGLTALAFLLYVAAAAAYTRRRVWGPAPEPLGLRRRRAYGLAAAITVPFLLGFLLWGGRGVLTATLPLALLAYLAWAAVQQTIFQFHLLGRLRLALPALPTPAVAVLGGLAYGLVHQPAGPLTAVTAVAGVVWSWSYLRDRLLLPLVLSHALLATGYYYGLLGRDLATEWLDRLHVLLS